LLPWGRRWSSVSCCWVVVAAAGCWLSCAILCLLLDWWFSRGDTNFHSTSTVIRIKSSGNLCLNCQYSDDLLTIAWFWKCWKLLLLLEMIGARTEDPSPRIYKLPTVQEDEQSVNFLFGPWQ
jgi:hypothetical protein